MQYGIKTLQNKSPKYSGRSAVCYKMTHLVFKLFALFYVPILTPHSFCTVFFHVELMRTFKI